MDNSSLGDRDNFTRNTNNVAMPKLEFTLLQSSEHNEVQFLAKFDRWKRDWEDGSGIGLSRWQGNRIRTSSSESLVWRWRRRDSLADRC